MALSRGKDDQISARDPGPAGPWQMDETLAVLDDVEEERLVRIEPEGPGRRELAPAQNLSTEAQEAQTIGENVEGERVGRSGPTGSRVVELAARSACQHADRPRHPGAGSQVSDLGPPARLEVSTAPRRRRCHRDARGAQDLARPAIGMMVQRTHWCAGNAMTHAISARIC